MEQGPKAEPPARARGGRRVQSAGRRLPGSVSKAKRFNCTHSTRPGVLPRESTSGFGVGVPVSVGRPLMTGQARRFSPFLLALRTDASRCERVPLAVTARRAVPAVVRRRAPGAPRAANLREVRRESPLVDAGRAFRKDKTQHGSPYVIFGHGGCVNSPPSTQMVWPVMKALSSLARKRTVRAMSSGWPTRPSGVTAPQVPA